MVALFLCHLPHVLIRHDTNRLMEHISEADTLVRLARIPTVHSLVNLLLLISLAHKVIDAEHHPLEMSPKAFN